ncbi:short-chain dehydrogenase [Xylaria sp. CBS 124048]|nr:short-chain dehydrogenase [Xylaria sp. CBS 124048]
MGKHVNKLAGKHIVVVGGSGGIGSAVVKAALECDAHVTIVASSQKTADAALSSVKAAYPDGQVVALACDLSKPTIEEDIDALLTRAAQLTGEIDHIVLSAADRLPPAATQTVSRDIMLAASQMLMVLPFMIGKVGQKHLKGASSALDAGRDKSITVTSGTISDTPAPGFTLSSFFAAGINGLMRGLALDLAPIRVNCVEAGPVDTPRWDAAFEGSGVDRSTGLNNMFKGLLIGRPAVPDEIAEAYMYLLRDTNTTGEVVRTGGGQHIKRP